jgi:hypothetical protein
MHTYAKKDQQRQLFDFTKEEDSGLKMEFHRLMTVI